MAEESLHIAALIANHLRQEATEAEKQELEAWRDNSPANRAFLDEKVRDEVIFEGLRKGRAVSQAAVYDAFIRKRDSQSRGRLISGRWIERLVAAAVIIVVARFAIPALMDRVKEIEPVIADPPLAVVDPGPKRGRLTFQDGKTVNLDSSVSGKLSDPDAMSIDITAGSRLMYRADLLQYLGVQSLLYENKSIGPSLPYHMIYVPYGSNYDLTMSDGTRAIVAAGSYLRYPAIHTAGRRVVELSGEAWFDVAPDKERPFQVKMNDELVDALGTQFACRSYPNEPSQSVILSQGAVRLSAGNKKVQLQPGEKAIIDERRTIVISKVDTAIALAWTRGFWNFDDQDLRAAICQLAQWHGMKVRVEKDVKARSLGFGNIAQEIPLKKLLDLLELPNLHFEIHDSTIVVKR